MQNQAGLKNMCKKTRETCARLIFSICHKLLMNAELCGLVLLGRRLKKGYHQIWEANLQTLGPMFQHLLILAHQKF
jgi:hypothetical protein